MTQDPFPADLPATHTDWVQQIEADRKAIHDQIARNKAKLFDALAALNITAVDINFDGCGDSGQIESLRAQAGDAACDLPDIPVLGTPCCFASPAADPERLTLTAALEAIVYDLLEATHDGWENNEGAYGDVHFDVARRTIRLHFNERIESTEYSEHEF